MSYYNCKQNKSLNYESFKPNFVVVKVLRLSNTHILLRACDCVCWIRIQRSHVHDIAGRHDSIGQLDRAGCPQFMESDTTRSYSL